MKSSFAFLHETMHNKIRKKKNTIFCASAIKSYLLEDISVSKGSRIHFKTMINESTVLNQNFPYLSSNYGG